MTRTKAALSIDLEYFHHTPAYRKASGTADSDDIGRAGVEFLLDRLADEGVKATFFIVSEIAETDPDLIEQIVADGHEIASHSHSHTLLTSLSEADQRAELTNSKDLLESVSGQSVTGFRAPAFDISDSHFEYLSQSGYAYDSSVMPSRRIPGWYGGGTKAVVPYRPSGTVSNTSDIVEVPVSVFPRLRLPLTGTWIRFFGVRYTTIGMRLLSRCDIAPVLYVHPWELVDLPEISGVPLRVYWHTGDWMRRAVEQVLKQSFHFVPIRELTDMIDR